MTIPSIAANAYQNAARLAGQAAGAQPKPTDPTADFGEMVKSAVQNVVDQGRDADAKSLEMMNGKANVVDVVTAVSETEVALQTMVSVRDKVIAAYEEIMRMPI